MANGKATNVTLITSELLKWTMLITHYWNMAIIDQTIKPGLSNDWLMNWIKPNFKARDKNQLSNYRTIMVSSTIAKLYSIIMEHKLAWVERKKNKHLGKQVLDQNTT